jgi:VCBS repeat-containing protein
VISSSPFTGGTDPQTYPVVTQSDIDNAAKSLIQANQPDPQHVLLGQLRAGEQLVDGTPQCTPQKSANQHAGDAVSQVTVTVTFTCTGEAYDHAGALALAANLLMDQAASNPGSSYALVGQIKTALVNAVLDTQGGVQVVMQAEGIWAYQFSTSQKQALSRLIAGKSQQEAMRLEAAQTGVAQARIQIQGRNGQAPPTDPQQIRLVIEPISGL